MPISEGQVVTELAQARALGGQLKGITAILEEVLVVLNDGTPFWVVNDPTAGQKSAILADYDAKKAAFKTAVAAF